MNIGYVFLLSVLMCTVNASMSRHESSVENSNELFYDSDEEFFLLVHEDDIPKSFYDGSMKDLNDLDKVRNLMVLERESYTVPSLESVSSCYDPKRLSDYCIHLVRFVKSNGSVVDDRMIRLAQTLALNILEVQEELAHKKYLLDDELARIDFEQEELSRLIQEKHHELEIANESVDDIVGFKQRLQKSENRNAISIKRNLERADSKEESLMRQLKKKIADLSKDEIRLNQLRKDRKTLTEKGDELTQRIVNLNKGIVLLRIAFQDAISKEACLLAAKELRKQVSLSKKSPCAIL